MKINIGTSLFNLQRVDTKGIKFNDLTGGLVKALAIDLVRDPDFEFTHPLSDSKKKAFWRGDWRVEGWAASGRKKNN